MFAYIKQHTSHTRFLAAILIVALFIGGLTFNSISASEATPIDTSAYTMPPPYYFAKYSGINGESDVYHYEDFIEILSIDWGAYQPSGSPTGATRYGAGTEVDNFVITFHYEEAAPKLLEKCLRNAVIPELVVELTKPMGYDQEPKTYLRYIMENVKVTSYDISGHAETELPPTVIVANSFEEITVTYTEYDDDGVSQGSVETNYNITEDRRRR